MSHSEMADAPLTDWFAIEHDLSEPVIAPAGGAKRGFGGHVAAIGLMAAYQDIAAAKVVRHVHVEFLRPSRVGERLAIALEHQSDGRSASRRTIALAHPGEAPTAIVSAMFWRLDGKGADFQKPAHDLPSVEGSGQIQYGPVEARLAPGDAPSRQRVLMRPRHLPLDSDPRLHEAALLFMSDLTVLWPTLTVHGRSLDERHTALATVSHSMWFHRPLRIDGWVHYHHEAVSTSAGLGQTNGRLFGPTGDLIASVMQVGLLKPSVPNA